MLKYLGKFSGFLFLIMTHGFLVVLYAILIGCFSDPSMSVLVIISFYIILWIFVISFLEIADLVKKINETQKCLKEAIKVIDQLKIDHRASSWISNRETRKISDDLFMVQCALNEVKSADKDSNEKDKDL